VYDAVNIYFEPTASSTQTATFVIVNLFIWLDYMCNVLRLRLVCNTDTGYTYNICFKKGNKLLVFNIGKSVSISAT
jgi:hypothetical protein